MKAVLILSLLILSGCASQFHERIYSPQRGGTVKYLNQGADFVVRHRAQDAERKMASFCSGEYQVTRESDSEELSGLVASQYMLLPVSSNYVFISFKCL